MKHIILLVFIYLTSWTFASLPQIHRPLLFKDFQPMTVYFKMAGPSLLPETTT